MNIRPLPTSKVHLGTHASAMLFPVVTMLLVAATLAGIGTSAPLLLGFLVVGVVALGLPHGSLDPLVANRLFAGDRRFSMARFLIAYMLLAALCVAGWLSFPNVALTVFLVISALHFSSDWAQRGSLWGRVAYGLCIVSVPTLRHAEAVRQIYLQLGASAAADIVSASHVVAWFAIALAFGSLLWRIRLRTRDLLELTVLVIAAIALQPLVFFICYFCLLHSPRHLAETSRGIGLHGLRSIGKAVAPPVAATLVLAVLLWRFLPPMDSASRILQVVFIGLAALTVPHMLLTAIHERANNRRPRSVRDSDVIGVVAS